MGFPFTPASVLEEHYRYLSAPTRLDAYARALREVLRPGDRVLDLGCGTGILGWLALEAGAGRVTAVDGGAMAGLARRLFEKNGVADRVTVVKGWSRDLPLPREFDVVVSDQLNPFALGGGLVESMADARERFLVPGGVLVPSSVRLEMAPVEDAGTWERVALWGTAPAGFDLSPAARHGRGARFLREVAAGALLGPPGTLAEMDLAAPGPGRVAGSVESVVERAGTLHFLAGWFRARLSPSVEISSAPGDPGRIAHRMQALLPAGGPVEVAPGDRVRATLTMDAVEEQVAWTVEVAAPGGGEPRFRASLSDFEASLVEASDLRALSPGHRPGLSRRGAAMARALALAGGGASVEELRAALASEFGDLLRDPRDVQRILQEILERFPGE